MEPAGGELNKLLKTIGRTLEGWFGVYFPYKDSLTMPFYKLSTQPSDSAAVTVQHAGHYCLSMLDGDPSKLLPIIYDSSKVFGEDSMMLLPIELQNKTVGDILKKKQYGFAKTSSAFAAGTIGAVHLSLAVRASLSHLHCISPLCLKCRLFHPPLALYPFHHY
jgi:hypothetical protein